MDYTKEILALHKKGFVLLQASRTTNAPIGWKRLNGTKKKWGYVEEMADENLAVYKSTFSAALLAKSHCGFYLGHGNLCCIDLDTKKTTIEATTALKDAIVGALGQHVAVERTKSNGWHIYFRYADRLSNAPDWMGLGKDNWIELYYSKRFIACYLSNSKKYTLEHGSIVDLPLLNKSQHEKLIAQLKPFKGKTPKIAKRKSSSIEVDKETWEDAEHLVRAIESEGLDITGDNNTWFRIGKGFANAFGSKGFDMFNRLSQFSPTYNEDEIENVYARFVEDDIKTARKKKVTIATFFKICADAEIPDRRSGNALKHNGTPVTKEFELVLSKKDSTAEKCHTVVTEFLKHVQLCCIDNSSFYIFQHTHWIKCNARFVIELINNFISRSTIDPRYIKPLRTVPYLELMLKELRMITQRDAIEPRTGSLTEGIYINMENGILHIDVRTGKRKLIDHDASYNFTTILPFCYDPAATSPKFDNWMDTQIPDRLLHEPYYAFVASCLTKHKADIILLLAGETSTGKSSLIDITRRVIGLENSVAISAGILFGGTSEAQTQAMQMENKLLAYDFDAQPFKHLEMLLKVAAQEPLPGWQMHVARRPVINYGRLIIAMNPYSYSVFNAAVARRFITINMDVPVNKDNTVMPDIYNNELAGIFNHVLNKGISHLIKNGGQVRQTESMRAATVKFHMGPRDSVRFLEERYQLLKAPKDTSSTKLSLEEKLRAANAAVPIKLTNISELYQEFRIWCEDVEGYPENKIIVRKHFATDLKQLGLEDTLIRTKSEVRRGLYIGLKLEK